MSGDFRSLDSLVERSSRLNDYVLLMFSGFDVLQICGSGDD